MLFGTEIGIDLGTANILIYKADKGIVLREPSVVTVDTATQKVIAVGKEAKAMLGRTPGSVMAIRPLKDGVVADFEKTKKLLQYFIRKATKNYAMGRCKIVICIPSGVTDVERRAVEDCAKDVGGKNVYLLEEPMAAAMGANLAVSERKGCMIVDIGGGTTEVAVISMDDIIVSHSERVAGDAIDLSIINLVRKKYNMLIGERTAEEIKINIGSACKTDKEETMLIKGRNLMTGLPQNIEITSEEVRKGMTEVIDKIVQAIKSTLERTPPELSADIIDNGITLAGGGALIKGLDTYIAQQTGINVFVAENPLDCVAVGAGKAFSNPRVLENYKANRDYYR